MSITLIAMTGILVGFLCLVIGFFMEDAKDENEVVRPSKRKVMKKKVVVAQRKAA